MLINWIKYRNSYKLYKLNHIYYDRKEKKILNKFGEKELNKFKKSENKCIWCKRIYRKSNAENSKYFCSLKCENLYNNEKYQVFKHNNVCKKHKNTILTYKNECWGCYKEKIRNEKIRSIKKLLITNYLSLNLIYGFEIIPTFRNSTNSWSGDKPAFEQSLIDKKVGWFVYIKFYVDKNNKIRPIVVGKSGSLKVNASGSDLNFSLNNEDGPSRRFINSSNSNWCYDFIMIRRVRTEKKAYNLERKIMNKYGFFGS